MQFCVITEEKLLFVSNNNSKENRAAIFIPV